MSNRNQVTGSFATIAVFDAATSNVTGIVVGNLSVTGANAAFSNISNIYIPGGTANQFIRTDGTGNLSWGFGGVTWNSGFTNSTVRTTQIGSLGNSSVTVQSPLGTAVTDFINSGSVFALGTDTANLYTVSTVSSVVLNTATLNFTPQLTQGYANSSFAFLANINQTLGIAPGSNTTFAISNGVITINSLPTGIANGTTVANVDAVNGNLTANSAANITLLAANNVSVTANSTGNLTLFGNNFTTVTANTGNLIERAAANIHWNAGSLGTASVPAAKFSGRDLYITRGDSALVSYSDEYISLGSNTAASTVVTGFNTANSQFAGMRFSKVGTERWFLGTDNTSANGNFILNTPATGTGTYVQGMRVLQNSGVMFRQAPVLFYSAAGVTQSATSGTVFFPQLVLGQPFSFASSVTEAEMGVSRSTSSPYTITINTAGVFAITCQVTFASNSVGYRAIALSSDSSTTFGAGTIYTRAAVPAINGLPTSVQAAIIIGFPAATTLTLKVLQNSGGALQVGGTQAETLYLSIARL